MTLTAAGVLSGTPTAAATSIATIRGTDANGCFAEVVYTIVIAPAVPPPPVCPVITLVPPTLPNGIVAVAYSQAITGSGVAGEVLSVTKSLFSPDGDGYEDYLEIVYNTASTGYTASMTVFESDGNKTKSLIREELAGTSGILRWDGDTDNGEKARPGIYILYFELFLPSGEVTREKKTVALVYK